MCLLHRALCSFLLFAIGSITLAQEPVAVDLADEDATTEFISTTSSSAKYAANAAPCNCPECQKKAAVKKATDLKKAIAGAYKPVFYDNNFAYINNPAYN